jgi:hypothetical protein
MSTKEGILAKIGELVKELAKTETQNIRVKIGDIVVGGYASPKARLVVQLKDGKIALVTVEGKNMGKLSSTARGTLAEDGTVALKDLVTRFEEGNYKVPNWAEVAYDIDEDDEDYED